MIIPLMNKYFYNIFQCGNLLIKAMSYLQLISVIPRVNSFQTVYASLN